MIIRLFFKPSNMQEHLVLSHYPKTANPAPKLPSALPSAHDNLSQSHLLKLHSIDRIIVWWTLNNNFFTLHQVRKGNLMFKLLYQEYEIQNILLKSFRKIIELFYLSIPNVPNHDSFHSYNLLFFTKLFHKIHKAKRDTIHTLMKLGKSPTWLDQEKCPHMFIARL